MSHQSFILLAYFIALIGIVSLIVRTFLKHRRLSIELNNLENLGVRPDES